MVKNFPHCCWQSILPFNTPHALYCTRSWVIIKCVHYLASSFCKKPSFGMVCISPSVSLVLPTAFACFLPFSPPTSTNQPTSTPTYIWYVTGIPKCGICQPPPSSPLLLPFWLGMMLPSQPTFFHFCLHPALYSTILTYCTGTLFPYRGKTSEISMTCCCC